MMRQLERNSKGTRKWLSAAEAIGASNPLVSVLLIQSLLLLVGRVCVGRRQAELNAHGERT
jgi:hypothetical protein